MRKNKKSVNLSKVLLKFKKTYIVWVLLVVFLISTVYLTIQTASSGAKLKMLEEEEIKLIKENRRLSSELVEYTSLTKIETLASELGFIYPENTFYIYDKEAVAKLP